MNYQICIAGSAVGPSDKKSFELAFEAGKSIAESGSTLVTGATVGLPQHAAMGANSAKGLTVGFSPASSRKEHTSTYRLPMSEFGYIHFTGMEFIGRDIHMIRSADAVIIIGGRMGSLHELVTALEARKVCAVLVGSGGVADFTKQLIATIPTPGQQAIIYEANPVKLVKKIIQVLDQQCAEVN